jgi:hypothetical protein
VLTHDRVADRERCLCGVRTTREIVLSSESVTAEAVLGEGVARRPGVLAGRTVAGLAGLFVSQRAQVVRISWDRRGLGAKGDRVHDEHRQEQEHTDDNFPSHQSHPDGDGRAGGSRGTIMLYGFIIRSRRQDRSRGGEMRPAG